MALDKRLPAVYVEIEDQSYMSEAIEAGRTAYCCIISDRGPHNQIVELNSRQDLYDLFGKPNFSKYGQGHYFVDQHLKRSGKIYVVRPVILTPPNDTMKPSDCCSIANTAVRFNDPKKHAIKLSGNYQITRNSYQICPTSATDVLQVEPMCIIKLEEGNTLQEEDYIEFTFTNVENGNLFIEQPPVVIDSNILDDMKNGGYIVPGNDLNCKIIYNETDNQVEITTNIVTDHSWENIISKGKVTLLPRSSEKASPVAADATGLSTPINLVYPITKYMLSVGDTFELKFQEIAPPNSIVTANVKIPQKAYLDKIIDDTPEGWLWHDNTNTVPDLILKANDSYLNIVINDTSRYQFDPSMYTDKGSGESEPSYNNYSPALEFKGDSKPGSDSIKGLTPGDPDELNIGDYVFQKNVPQIMYQIKDKIEDNGQTCLIISPFGDPQQVTQNKIPVPVTPGEDGPAPVLTPSAVYRGELYKYNHLASISIGDNQPERMIDKKQINELDVDTLWHFYVNGAGKYYNNIYIKGVRNSTYDRMYTDEDGNPEYPYAFMDIAIYRDNNDGTSTLLEGPWTVSLMDRTSKDVVIKDIYTGLQMYLPVVINRKSKIVRVVECRGVDQLTTMNVPVPYEPDTKKRMQIQDLIAGKLADCPDGIRMKNGSDGNMFDSMGRINLTDELVGLLCQAYDGSLQSTDGSIERLLSVIYPWYLIDYIYCGGWGHNVNFSAKELADLRNDCLLLSDTGLYKESHDEDMEARQKYVPWNTWNAALYTNYRKIFDPFTSKSFYVSPIYHAIDRHLYTDDRYWIAEPVAGIEKGAIEEAIELAYGTNETQLADEIDAELNPVIIESDGTYILQQFTTWKRLSIMKRQHVVKFVQYCKKKIPGILKDILHRKATNYWIQQANSRVNTFMIPFVDSGDSNRYAAVSTFSVQCSFDDESSELTVLLTIKPLRSIEKITVNIIVT